MRLPRLFVPLLLSLTAPVMAETSQVEQYDREKIRSIFGWNLPQVHNGSAGNRSVQSSPHHTNVHAKQHSTVAAGPFPGDVAVSPPTHGHTATVLQVINAEGFNTTYMQLQAGDDTIWVASGLVQVSEGNQVAYSPSQMVTMENFESKALARTFDKLYLLPAVQVVSNASN